MSKRAKIKTGVKAGNQITEGSRAGSANVKTGVKAGDTNWG